MTPLSKCLYKGMKIDQLDRFLEGKINRPCTFTLDLIKKKGQGTN